jgi:transcriptional regulator with XRE-family HTH domain
VNDSSLNGERAVGPRPKPKPDSKRGASQTDKLIGARVRKARLERNMSQQDLADRLGLTFQQVQKYELGANRIAATRLVEIAKRLEKPIVWFLSEMTETATAIPPAHDEETWRVLATPEGAALVAQFARIESLALRRSILSIVTALVEGAAPSGFQTMRPYRRRDGVSRA